jgi:hypothetical protein
MLRQLVLSGGAVGSLALGLGLGGCGKVEPQRPAETARTRAEAKRHKDACASTAAYDRMKRAIFSQAGRELSSHPTNLATLEEFAFVRMEDPVVEGFDPTLDLTRCRGRFILDVPPGSAQAFGGEHRLQADITYTAQGAADGSGLVYVIHGAQPIVGKLAAFNLADATYRPLPAVDVDAPAAATDVAVSATPPNAAGKPRPASDGATTAKVSTEPVTRQDQMPALEPKRPVARELAAAPRVAVQAPEGLRGEGTVRTFYNALGAGNGNLASAQVIPAKRSSRAYSPDAISRFYGRLSTPMQLTGVSALSGNTYRVTYRYAGAGIRCNGSAVVRLTSTADRPLIRSITAQSGC